MFDNNIEFQLLSNFNIDINFTKHFVFCLFFNFNNNLLFLKNYKSIFDKITILKLIKRFRLQFLILYYQQFFFFVNSILLRLMNVIRS